MRLRPSSAYRPASAGPHSETSEHWKITVPNTSPQPGLATADRAALTTVMDGAVAVLSMGLPPYNLMDRVLNRELIKGLEWARREGARAVVLRSSLRHFSAGADLDAMVADADEADVLDWGFVETLRAFDEHPAPIVASIHGACLMVIAQELAHGPSIANAATKRLVSVAVNEGIAAADEAMAEIQRPILHSADFRGGVTSYRENGVGTAKFEGR